MQVQVGAHCCRNLQQGLHEGQNATAHQIILHLLQQSG